MQKNTLYAIMGKDWTFCKIYLSFNFEDQRMIPHTYITFFSGHYCILNIFYTDN